MTTTVTFNTIKNMAVEVKNPLSDRVIHVVGAFMAGFAEGWVKYATNNAIVSDDVLCRSIGASNVREALKIGLLERMTDHGYEAGSEVFNLAVEQLDDDMAWNMEIYKARGLSHEDAWKKAVSEFYPEMNLS